MTPKADKPVKPAPAKQAKPATAKQPKAKLVEEKSTKPTPLQKAEKEATRPLPVVEGKGKAISTEEQATQSLLALHTSKKRKQGEDVDNKVYLEEKITELDEGQAGSDPDPGQSHVALAGLNPEPMHDDFIAMICQQVHESLKHTTEEHVQMENPLSLTGTLSSMKNLDNFNFGDQFIAEKSPEDEPGNTNVDTKVESMVTVSIHQASFFVPLLSTPVIDLSPPKPISITTFIAATTETITTTLPLPPPP
nr:hypothetical protein [Tanacetum cinerariifolium]